MAFISDHLPDNIDTVKWIYVNNPIYLEDRTNKLTHL